MNMHRILPLVLAMLIIGCGKSENIQHPPQALTTYEEHIDWQNTDSMNAGSGDGDMYLQLQAALRKAEEGVFIYTADYKGNVFASLMNDDFERVWRTSPDDADITGGAGAGSGIVLVGTSKGQVIAFSQDEGEELWRTNLSSEILSPPQSADGIAVALTEDSRVYGLNAKTGEIEWRYQQTAPLLQLRGSAPMIIHNGVVYVGFANGFISALDLETGRLLWQQAVSYPRGRSEIDRVVDVNGRMAIYENILYIVNYQGRAIAVDTLSHRLLWEKSFSSYKGLAVDEHAVFITDDDSVVWALDRETGDTLWQQTDLLYREVSAPAVYEDMVAVGDYEGYVHLMLASNGQLLGRVRADSSAINTAPVTINGQLLVLSSDGKLVRLAPIRTS